MSFKTKLLGAAIAILMAGAAFADGAIMVLDPYFRTSRPGAPTGAAFMVLMNRSDRDDRLVSASSDIAARVELHTHRENADGVMQMSEIEGGIPLPAQAGHALERGGDHVMFMGLKQPLEQGDTVTVTLTFEHAPPMTVEIPVDLERRPGQGHGHKTDG